MPEDALRRPPASDEVEISLFGPGVGESVVVHLGEGEWMIVDSHLYKGRPVALRYLDELGVAPTQVRVVVATHWHDDHIKGLGTILEECAPSMIVCSPALARKEFVGFVEEREGAMIASGSGVDEFREILRHFGDKIFWAKWNALVWQRAGRSRDVIWALSPSDESIRRSLERLSRAAAAAALSKKRVTELDGPNHVSIALWLSLGPNRVVLGSDLEESGNGTRGWSAVLSGAPRPWKPPASVFKVPHHGSDDSHHDGVWDELLTRRAFALVTPYFRGRRFLPSDEDRKRIRARTERSYITVAALPERKVKRAPEVEKQLRIRAVHPVVRREFGHLRLRAGLKSTDWTLEQFGAAGPL